MDTWPTPVSVWSQPSSPSRRLLSPETGYGSADIEQAYYMLWMHRSCWAYQCYLHKGDYIMPKVLLFGMSQAPWVFTKTNKPALAFCRVLLLKITNFIDDWLTAANAKAPRAAIEFVLWLLTRLGWMLSVDKCVIDPVQVILYLGMLIDSVKYEFRVPQPKVDRARALKVMLERAYRGERLQSQDVRRLTGQVLSFSLAIPCVRVWTRSLYAFMPEEGDCLLLAGPDQIEELEMLDRVVVERNGNPIRCREFSDTVKLDAGETGAGGHLLGGDLSFSEALPDHLIGTSSTRREMQGFAMFLEAEGATLAGRRVRFMFDSAASVCILVKGGSRVPVLTRLTKDIFLLLQRHCIDPVYEWTPRENNVLADKLSKRFDQSWQLTRGSTRLVQNTWPNIPISLVRFNTISNWLESRGPGPAVLIAPFWPAQRWWPVLSRRQCGVLHLGVAFDVFQPKWANDPVGVGKPAWRIAAYLLQ